MPVKQPITCNIIYLNKIYIIRINIHLFPVRRPNPPPDLHNSQGPVPSRPHAAEPFTGPGPFI